MKIVAIESMTRLLYVNNYKHGFIANA